jgi:hypothetical protein
MPKTGKKSKNWFTFAFHSCARPGWRERRMKKKNEKIELVFEAHWDQTVPLNGGGKNILE